MKFFSPDNPFFVAMSRLWDMVVMNVLWIVCCIPIVTIGASTTALYRTVLELQYRKTDKVIKTFFHAFKTNFKQGTLAGLLLLIPAVVAYFNFSTLMSNVIQGNYLVFFASVLPLLLLIFVALYVFWLIAWFENSLLTHVKNAWILSIAHLPTTLLMLLLNFLPLIVALLTYELFMKTMIIWVMMGTAAIAYGNGTFIRKIFKKMGVEVAPNEDIIPVKK